MPTVTTSTTTETTISSSVRRKLLTKLNTYKALKTQLDGIKAQMKTLTDELGEIRDIETGEMSLKLEGVATITLVGGVYKKFNEKKFVAQGGDLAIYKMSIDEKPKRSYNKVTLAGEKDEEE